MEFKNRLKRLIAKIKARIHDFRCISETSQSIRIFVQESVGAINEARKLIGKILRLLKKKNVDSAKISILEDMLWRGWIEKDKQEEFVKVLKSKNDTAIKQEINKHIDYYIYLAIKHSGSGVIFSRIDPKLLDDFYTRYGVQVKSCSRSASCGMLPPPIN